jgi:hypothetical protein
MQISKERFRQLIREEVENHLQEQTHQISVEEEVQNYLNQQEAKIRIEWAQEFVDTLDVSEKNYRRLLEKINSLRTGARDEEEGALFPGLEVPTEDPRKKIQEGSLLMERPPDPIAPSGKPEEKGVRRKWAPHLWHQNPNIKAAIKYIKRAGPWARVSTRSCHLAKAKGNCIPGPSSEVCRLMKIYAMDPNVDATLAGLSKAKKPIGFPTVSINNPAFFHSICLDPRRAAADERPNRICGDFKTEMKAYREGRQTIAREAWTGNWTRVKGAPACKPPCTQLLNWCNWPIPTSGIVITDPVQRAIPLVFLEMASPAGERPEDPEELAKWKEDSYDIYFKSERTQALRDVERAINAAHTPEAGLSVMVGLGLFAMGGTIWRYLLALLGVEILLYLNSAFESGKIELTEEQHLELVQALADRGHSIDLSKEASAEEKPSWSEPLKKFGCTVPPHTRPLTPFDLERYEKTLLEKPWNKKEGDEFQSYAQRSTGRVGGNDDLVKQYRIWKLLGSSAASNYIPGKWPTTPAVQKLLKDFRRDDDWNKFEQCMRKSPFFKQEYGDIPVGFLSAPPSPEKKEIESCIENFADPGEQGARREKGQEYRRRTGRDLPAHYYQKTQGAPLGPSLRIMNQRCLQRLCKGGNKLACRALKK